MPPGTGLRRVVTLQNRTCVDVTFLLSAEFAKKIVDLVELCLDQIVVIIAPRVARDSAGNRGLGDPSLFTLEIIQCHDHYRSRAGQNLLRIATFLFAALHIMHFAMRAFAQPLAKFRCMRRFAASRDATQIETNLMRERREPFL